MVCLRDHRDPWRICRVPRQSQESLSVGELHGAPVRHPSQPELQDRTSLRTCAGIALHQWIHLFQWCEQDLYPLQPIRLHLHDSVDATGLSRRPEGHGHFKPVLLE